MTALLTKKRATIYAPDLVMPHDAYSALAMANNVLVNLRSLAIIPQSPTME